MKLLLRATRCLRLGFGLAASVIAVGHLCSFEVKATEPRALSAEEKQAARDGVRRYALQALEDLGLSKDADGENNFQMRLHLAGLLLRAGDSEGGHALFDEISREVGDLRDEGSKLIAVAVARGRARDEEGAARDFRKARPKVERPPKPPGPEDSLDAVNRNFRIKAFAQTQANANDLAGAIETLVTIDDERSRGEVRREIARAQAQAGDFAAASRTAGQIDGTNDRDGALAGIALWQARRGAGTSAIETARSVQAASKRANALAEVARVLAKRGDEAAAAAWREARNVSLEVPEGGERNSVLFDLAMAQLRAGDLPAAKSTALSLRGATVSESLAFYVAVFESETGNPGAASITLAQVADPELKVVGHCEIAGAYAKTGDLTRARNFTERAKGFASNASDAATRAECLRAVAVAQAQAGDVRAAKETVALIESSSKQGSALRSIASAQIDSGDVAGALATAESLRSLFYRNNALLIITGVLAERGDAQGAKAAATRIRGPKKGNPEIGQEASRQALRLRVTGDARSRGFVAAEEWISKLKDPIDRSLAYAELANLAATLSAETADPAADLDDVPHCGIPTFVSPEDDD